MSEIMEGGAAVREAERRASQAHKPIHVFKGGVFYRFSVKREAYPDNEYITTVDPPEEQTKRGPGRPRKTIHRWRIDITLPYDVIEYIDNQMTSRSQFVEGIIREKMAQAG